MDVFLVGQFGIRERHSLALWGNYVGRQRLTNGQMPRQTILLTTLMFKWYYTLEATGRKIACGWRPQVAAMIINK